MNDTSTDCASANKQWNALMLNSTPARDWHICMRDGCGCTPASSAAIFQFGLVVFFGMLGFWFK